MTAQVLDIGTICQKCDFEFVVTYVSHEAEDAEAALPAVMTRAAQLESEKRAVEFQRDVLRNERDEAHLELQQIRTMLDSGMDETAIDMVKRLHGESYESRRQFAEMRNERDAARKQLEQARKWARVWKSAAKWNRLGAAITFK